MPGTLMSCLESMVFDELERITARPAPFSALTTTLLWTDPCTSEHMLRHHLDGTVAISSHPTERIERSVDWLTSTLGVGAGTRVLDLGCGPGLYSNRLAAAGATVTGVDFSERSIRYARQTAPSSGPGAVTYIHGDYLDVPIPGTFDVAVMIMCDFCALGPQQRGHLLERLSGLLDTGGRFVFDVYGLPAMAGHTQGYSFTPNPEGGFWSHDPYFEFVSAFVYEAERVTLDRYEIVEPHRSRTIFNWLQHYDPQALAAELDRNGFEVAEFLGDLAGTPFDPHATEFAAVSTPRR